MTADRDRDLDDEVAAHLRMAIDERVKRGESRDAADAAVRREFGNVTHIKEVTREQRRSVWLERLVQDIRYGARGLRRTPAFTITAVATLAIAIGANSAVFTVVNSVLLRPLAFRGPDRLYALSLLPNRMSEMSPAFFDRDWLLFRDRQRSFSQVAAYQGADFTLSGAGEATRLSGAHVDGAFFAALGVSPTVGRTFGRDEDASGDHVALLSDRLWRDRFGASQSVVDATITLDGAPYRVIGVMPPDFSFPERSDVWTPINIRLDADSNGLHRRGWFPVLGRLRDGTTAVQAHAELMAIAAGVPHDPSEEPDQRMTAAIVPLKDVLTGKVAASLWIFTGAVAFVLLIACANLANLLLIRAAARRHELAVRVALGAGRALIARQLLTESMLVGLGGGALGLVLAEAGVRTLIAIAPAGRIPRLNEVHLDGWVLAFTVAASLVTGIGFGVLPAVISARRAPHDALSNSGRVVGGGQSRLRGALVTAEVALALVLLTGAGLMIKSFARMRAADKGYDGSRVMTMSVDLPGQRYADSTRLRAFHGRLLDELARIPGVRSVGAVSWRPMGGVGMMGSFAVEGGKRPRDFYVDKTLASPGYITAMGLRLERGRDFAAGELGTGVVIVSESVARILWPGVDPVGKRVSMDNSEPPAADSWLTVVGVVSDVVHDQSMSKHATMYFPYRQSGWSSLLNHMTYVVRTEGRAVVAPAMRAALRDIDPTVPAQELMSMDDALMEVVAEPVFQTRLLTVFAAIALLLAAIGTYGVLAYDVTQRSREVAVRMALGATPGDVIRMVMRRTGALAMGGAAVGVVGSLATMRVLSASLYDVKPTDPTTMIVVVIAILVVAALAGWAPARRASRVHVVTALSAE